MARVQWVMQLNNFLQSRSGSAAGLRWFEEQALPLNSGNWKVTCIIDGKRYGSGTASTKKDAKELAAKETLRQLNPSLHNRLLRYCK